MNKGNKNKANIFFISIILYRGSIRKPVFRKQNAHYLIAIMVLNSLLYFVFV